MAAFSLSLLVRPQSPSAYTCRACLRRRGLPLPRALSSSTGRQEKSSAVKDKGGAAKDKSSRSSSSKEKKTETHTPARTRFAPSPTGYLHLGSLRTALFNYLLAKHTGGQFLLRIEDTDQKRTVADAEDRLLRDLRWAGLQWDEGPQVGGPYGPYKQSERSAIYREHAHRLLQSGHAYRCFCSPARLAQLAQHRHHQGLATDYDRHCLAALSAHESDERAHRGEPFVVRLKVPDQYPAYDDLIYGAFKPLKKRGHVTESAYEDPILLKSDGLPTYHLANVVDDHLMEITHVIRGCEWMPSTPKHIALYTAFGWTPPAFAHVGLLVDEHGNKLSKRNFDTDIAAFGQMEIFPETLTNFAALLGWSHREKTDVMDLATLVKNFSLKFTKGNTTVTFGKLHFLQRKHALARAQAGGAGLQEMVQNVATLLTSPDTPYKDWAKIVGTPFPHEYIQRIIQVDAENYTNANEFLYRNSFFFTQPDPKSITTFPRDHDAPPDNPDAVPDDIPPSTKKRLAHLSPSSWDRDHLMQQVRDIIDGRPEGKAGSKHVYHYLRKALTGQDKGMRIYDVMLILGRDETLRRLI